MWIALIQCFALVGCFFHYPIMNAAEAKGNIDA